MTGLLGDYWGHHDGIGLLGWLISILLLVVVVAGIVALVSWLAGWRAPARPPVEATRPPGSGEDEALATLRMRYARGEIGRDEFLQASRDLGAPAPPEPPSPTG